MGKGSHFCVKRASFVLMSHKEKMMFCNDCVGLEYIYISSCLHGFYISTISVGQLSFSSSDSPSFEQCSSLSLSTSSI